jgi:hypothetical protein
MIQHTIETEDSSAATTCDSTSAQLVNSAGEGPWWYSSPTASQQHQKIVVFFQDSRQPSASGASQPLSRSVRGWLPWEVEFHENPFCFRSWRDAHIISITSPRQTPESRHVLTSKSARVLLP